MLAEDITLKITTDFVVKLKTKEVQEKVRRAVKESIRDAVTDVAGDVIKLSPYLLGNNARSIRFEVGPGQEIARGEFEGAIYSTSGYGGYLETGTVKMAPRPYFRPALDLHIRKLPKNIKTHLSRGF